MPAKYKGIAWFIFQCFTTSITFAIVRFAIKDINIFTMTFIQSCFALLFISPFILKEGISSLKTSRLKLHIVRNIFGLGGTSCFFYGVTKIPLDDATSISFTGPLFTTIAAILVLREKAKKHRVIGLTIGFIGALVVLHPAGGLFNPYSCFILLSVILMGFVQVFIAMLNKTEPVKRVLFYMVFLTVLMTAPLAALNWVTPHWQNIAWIFLLTIFIYLNLIGIVQAYRHTEINVLMPFDFSRLVFTGIVAYVVFNEKLTLTAVIGSVVILLGIVYVLGKERAVHKNIAEL